MHSPMTKTAFAVVAILVGRWSVWAQPGISRIYGGFSAGTKGQDDRVLQRKHARRAKGKNPPPPSPPPPSPPPPPPSPTRAKKGLILGGQVVQASVEHFSNAASWFYNYDQTAEAWQGNWADNNSIEFVPMIPKPYVGKVDGSRCYFSMSKTPLCSLQDVVDVLNKTKAERTGPVQYLMGFNEMYNNPPPEDLTPLEAVGYWRQFVQPAADVVGLKLVSPTTKANEKGAVWFADFLKHCWDKRDEPNDPCKIELIEKFSVHEYDCKQSTWNDKYEGDGSALIDLLTVKLEDYGGKTNNQWANYLKSRNLWVTETNCYWESVAPHPSSMEQCLRITGQKAGSHGTGSVAAMEAIENIERYSWWTTWNQQIKPNYLTYRSGRLTPVGLGYLYPNSTTACDFPGTRFDAGQATLGGLAEIVTCGTTNLVKNLGKGGGTATFTVSVPYAGDYPLNVGFVTAVERILSVTINNEPEQTFPFISSGDWCGNGGVPTVLPIELTGFVNGSNTVTFGTQTSENEPLIEWISVVV